jgi:uncharacterized DUF497 family protein
MRFRWNDRNVEHLGKHGISATEAQFIVNHARRPFPEMIGEGKRYVAGQTANGRYVQVIYVIDPDGTAYVIHARPLNAADKRKYRRRIR